MRCCVATVKFGKYRNNINVCKLNGKGIMILMTSSNCRWSIIILSLKAPRRMWGWLTMCSNSWQCCVAASLFSDLQTRRLETSGEIITVCVKNGLNEWTMDCFVWMCACVLECVTMVTCTSLPDGAPPATNFRPRFHWWGREARQDAHQVTDATVPNLVGQLSDTES